MLNNYYSDFYDKENRLSTSKHSSSSTASQSDTKSVSNLIQEAEKRITLLMTENRRLTDSLEIANEEIIRLQSHVIRTQDLELTVSNLKSENEQLGRVIKEKLNFEEKYRTSMKAIQQHEQKIESLVEQIRQFNNQQRGSTGSELKLVETEKMLERVILEKERIEKENNRLQRTVRDMEDGINKVFGCERSISELEEELSLWKMKYDNLNMQNEEDMRRYKVDIERAMKLKYEDSAKANGQECNREKTEYEKTVRSFKEKIGDFERKLQMLVGENERLLVQLDAKEKEIEVLKKSEGKQKEIDEERRDLLNTTKEVEARNVEQMQEIWRLRNDVTEKDEEIEQLTRKCIDIEKDSRSYIDKAMEDMERKFKQKLQKEKDQLEATVRVEKQQFDRQIGTYITKVSELEAQAVQLTSQNSILTCQFEERNHKIIALKDTIETLTKEKEQQLSEQKTLFETERKTELEIKIRSLELNSKEKEDLYEAQVADLKQKVQDFELRQVLYFIEIERIYAINSNLIDELNKLSTEVRTLTKENTSLNADMKGLNTNLTTMCEERTKFEKLAYELTQKIEAHDQRTQTLLKENERLGDLSITRLKEIDELKTLLSSRAANQEDVRANKHLESLKKAHNDLREMAVMFETEKNNMEAQLKQLKYIIESNRAEIIMLQEVNQQRKMENEELHGELVRGSSRKIRELEEELKHKTQHNEQCLRENEELRIARDFLRHKLEQISLKEKEYSNERYMY